MRKVLKIKAETAKRHNEPTLLNVAKPLPYQLRAGPLRLHAERKPGQLWRVVCSLKKSGALCSA